MADVSFWSNRRSPDSQPNPRPNPRPNPGPNDRRGAWGRWGERCAARYLTAIGLRVVARRLRTPFAEVDLVAIDGRDLVVVEVKSCRRPPEAPIAAGQRARLRAAAEWLLARWGDPEAGVRIDLVWVERRFRRPRVWHQRAALESSDEGE